MIAPKTLAPWLPTPTLLSVQLCLSTRTRNTADAADMGFDALSQAEAIDVDEEEVSQPGDRELC